MAKLEVTQRRCDKRKYEFSIANNRDMSGKMNYCANCKSCVNGQCVITHEQRVAENVCAKSYERIIKALRRTMSGGKENGQTSAERAKEPPLKPSACDCSKYLGKYGKITEYTSFPQYVCPNCGSIKHIDTNPINWEKVK